MKEFWIFVSLQMSPEEKSGWELGERNNTRMKQKKESSRLTCTRGKWKWVIGVSARDVSCTLFEG